MAVVSIFVGATVQSTVGFGTGMIAMPILLLNLDPQTAVVIVNTMLLPISTLILLENRRHLRAREMVPIAAAGVAGVALGVFILSSSEEGPLKIAIVVLIMMLTVVMALHVRRSLPKPGVVGPASGFLTALLISTIGTGGPVVVLFVLTRGWYQHAVRGSLALYLMFIVPLALAGYGVSGLYTVDLASLTGAAAVPAVAGYWLGSRISHRMNERVFRGSAIAVTLATSLTVLVREIARYA